MGEGETQKGGESIKGEGEDQEGGAPGVGGGRRMCLGDTGEEEENGVMGEGETGVSKNKGET